MRDQKIPIIAFVANTGGLLGLCMGFSLVSVFEILYHLFCALKTWWSFRGLRRSGRRLVNATLQVAGTTAYPPQNATGSPAGVASPVPSVETSADRCNNGRVLNRIRRDSQNQKIVAKVDSVNLASSSQGCERNDNSGGAAAAKEPNCRERLL